jgi:hypothetical protein
MLARFIVAIRLGSRVVGTGMLSGAGNEPEGALSLGDH